MNYFAQFVCFLTLFKMCKTAPSLLEKGGILRIKKVSQSSRLGRREEFKSFFRRHVVRMGLLHAAAALRRDGSVSAPPFFLSKSKPML